MNIQLDIALLEFGKWVIGRSIRGQQVESVSLEMDTLSQSEHPLRYILRVYFRENPPPASDPAEKKLLRHVFSDVPSDARFMTHDVSALRARLVGLQPIHEDEWRLSDE